MKPITDNIFNRTEDLIGSEALRKLTTAKVAVFGLGGVGAYAVEALARAGVGELTLVDKDVVSSHNINRQLLALISTIGRPKVDVMAERIQDINPTVSVITSQKFYLPENRDEFNLSRFDYVIDATDTVTAKIDLAVQCAASRTPIISCMGAGNKLDPTRFQVADIYETSVCPLCRVMRKELKKRGVKMLKVVYSTEEPVIKGRTSASISFVPSVAGFILAGEVVKALTRIKLVPGVELVKVVQGVKKVELITVVKEVEMGEGVVAF